MKIQFDTPPVPEANGLPVRYAAAKRQMPRWRWYLLLALVLMPPTYLLARFAASFGWTTAPAVVLAEQRVARSAQAGRVVRAPGEGAHLKAGETIVTLQTAPPPSAEASAPRLPPAVLPRALQARMRSLQEALALHQQRLDTLDALRAQGAATRQEVDNAQLAVLQALAGLQHAQADLDGLQREPSPAPRQAHAAQSPATPAVQAPFDARVVRSLVHDGEWVTAGTDIALLQSLAPPRIHAFLSPADARYAQPGRKASLRFMDGGRIAAQVQAVDTETERLPAERNSPLAPRLPAIVVQLRPLEPLPAAYRIHQLPLDVRFDWIGW